MRETLKPLLVGILAIAFGSLAKGPMAQTSPAGPAPGLLVDIGGHRLHIRCVGPATEGPTVILEAGAGDFSNRWAAVQDLLSPRVRNCAYDRAGSGWSEAGPVPRTMRQEVFELHTLLEAARVPGPFILVGHSMGGLLVRLYTEQYGGNVIGVVLVDSTNEDGRLFFLRQGQWMRVREQATGRTIPAPRREGGSNTQDNSGDDYMAEEFQQMYLSRKDNPESLGNRPLIVLAAGKSERPPGPSDELWLELRQEKDEQLMDLTRLSRNSKYVRDPSSGHNIHVDNPLLVARAIEEVIEAAVKGAKLVP